MTRAEHIIPLPEAFPAVEAWLNPEGCYANPEVPTTVACDIAERFGLDRFGRNILLLCAYTTLEPAGRAAVAQLLGDPMVAAPTVGLALSRVPGAHWQALAAEAPLRRSGLIQIDGNGPFVDARLRLPETVLFSLLGAPGLDAGTATLVSALPAPRAMAPNRKQLAKDIHKRLKIQDAPVLHLTGPDPDGKLCAFAQATGRIGARSYVLHSELLPQSPEGLVALADALARDMVLMGARLILMHDDQAEPRFAQLFAETYREPLAIASTEPLQVGQRMALRLEMPLLKAAEQLDVWRTALGPLAKPLAPDLPKMAATFRVAPELAETIAAELALEKRQIRKKKKEGEDLSEIAWAACRRAARPRMDDLAQRVTSPAEWDDLILPARQKDILDSIVAQVRHRATVYEDWGFGPRLQNKGLGVSALFSGPSGAGKSMAGEVIGNRLQLDVYRVDLSAMVSKWVGETEKNLRRVFDAAEDGGVILQFDEADALFGRRSEVKDSHDRHANIEVSYLLQRLEAYRGLCILTTNMRDNIDEAFLRRLRFIVDFRFPSRQERLAIWKGVFPKGLPKGQLDYDCLSQLNVAGGSIRNIALAAAFLAADRGAKVSMAEILHAAHLEYDKVGRSMTDAERAGWLQ